MKRVAHFIGRLIPGGVERRTLELLAHTAGEPLEHYVFLTSGRTGQLDQDYLDLGARLLYQPIHKFRSAFTTLRELRKNNVDVVHSNIMYTSGYILLIARLAGVKNRIAHFQSDGTPSSQLSPLRKLQRYLLKVLIDLNATHIVALTPESMEIAWNPRWKDDQRCSIIPNGVVVDATHFPESPAPLMQFVDDTKIIHVGRGDLATKNRSKAVSVLGEYVKSRPDTVLLFLGRDGADSTSSDANRSELLALARSQGVEKRVFFLGQVDNVADYLRNCDLLLFTSLLEGLPGVVIEALSCGLPVVASDIPGDRYIASILENIQLVDPYADDAIWAQYIRDAAPETTEQFRQDRISQMKASVFDIEVSSKAYLRLWNG